MTDHDYTDPQAWLNGLEAAALAARLRCPHCSARYSLLTTAGGWAVEEHHQVGCPLHEDSSPAHEEYVGDRPELFGDDQDQA